MTEPDIRSILSPNPDPIQCGHAFKLTVNIDVHMAATLTMVVSCDPASGCKINGGTSAAFTLGAYNPGSYAVVQSMILACSPAIPHGRILELTVEMKNSAGYHDTSHTMVQVNC